ncbi:MAG: HEAT repeat domain-containing protein [Planctomycetes bacterium]|nr:HEAT repeat domain-containing protein [Planctomycetota bacterium]
MRSLRLLCFLWLFSSLFSLCAQDEAARLDATREFLKYWKKVKDEASQIAAIDTLRGNECRPAADELLKLCRHPSAGIQQAAFAVLETFRAPATFQTWIDELPKQKDAEQIALLVKVFGRSKVASALPAIEAVAMDPKASNATRYEAARALHAIGSPGAAGLLPRLLGDADPLVRMAAADAAGAFKLGDTAKPLIGLLADPQWQVQSAAIGALAALRPMDAVQPMIDLMKKTGRLRTECADALFRITGMDLGVDPERWQDQWKTQIAIPGWRIPTDEELAKKAAARQKSDQFYGKKGEATTFAKIPTTSTNVLFIIDVSGSMDELVLEREKFQGYRDFRKFTIVQAELMAAIEGLSDNTNFDIVAFATDIDAWKKRLVPANVVNRDAAKSWVKNLKPIGGSESQEMAASGLSGAANLAAGKTNTLKALLYAFGVDPEKPAKAVPTGADKAAVKSPLDTVYFLSDGKPSVGKLVDPNEIRKEIRRHNEVYRIVIHTIAIGEFQKEFLSQLAEENGGMFMDMGR